MPAMAPPLRDDDEEPPELPLPDEQPPVKKQDDVPESFGGMVTTFDTAPSCHEHADTLNTPRS